MAGDSQGRDAEFERVKGSKKLSHQLVSVEGTLLGDVWREECTVVVSGLTAPRKMAKKMRWLGRTASGQAVGSGTRAAMLFGRGYATRQEVVKRLVESSASSVQGKAD